MHNFTQSTPEEASATKLLNGLRILSAAGVAVAATVFTLYFFNFSGALSEKPDVWGQFGDFIGGTLNPIFSLLALLALLATFTLQLQEFRLSTKELRNSAEALMAQHLAMQRQIFENTFFQLLSLHNELLNGIDLVGRSGNLIKGRDCFAVFVNRANSAINNRQGSGSNLSAFRLAYEEFQKIHDREISHYFRTLYNLIKYIDSTKGIDAQFYANIVRAQLSSNEVTLLMYNCISEAGYKKFRPLVERYSLLKGLTELSVSEKLIEEVYSVQAFGKDHPLVRQFSIT